MLIASLVICVAGLQPQGDALQLPIAPAPRRLTSTDLFLKDGYSSVPVRCDPAFSWLFADLEIGGRSYSFVIDCGADTSWFSNSAFKLQQFKLDPFTKLNIGLDRPRGAVLKGELLDFSRGDGILGARDMTRYDGILDFKYERLLFRMQPGSETARKSLTAFLDVDGRQSVKVIRSKSGRLYVDVLVEKRICHLFVDTGSVCNLLFRDTAKRLGYRPGLESGYLPGLAGIKVRAYQSCTPRCSFAGDLESEQVPFIITDELPPELKGDEDPFDGVLGAQFCHQAGVAIDFSVPAVFAFKSISDKRETEIEGTWKLEAIADGTDRKLDESAPGAKLVCRGNSVRYFNGFSWIEYTIKTYPHKSPMWLDMFDGSGVFTPARCAVTGKSLALAFYPSTDPMRRPGGVTPEAGFGLSVLRFVRE